MPQTATKFPKFDIRRAHLSVQQAPFPKRTPVASPPLSCYNSPSAGELGGPTSDDSTINLLEEREWADGRWKKGGDNEVKRQSATGQPHSGKPRVLTLWVWLHAVGHVFGKGTAIVDIAELPSKAPFDRDPRKNQSTLLLSYCLSAPSFNKDMGFMHIKLLFLIHALTFFQG